MTGSKITIIGLSAAGVMIAGFLFFNYPGSGPLTNAPELNLEPEKEQQNTPSGNSTNSAVKNTSANDSAKQSVTTQAAPKPESQTAPATTTTTAKAAQKTVAKTETSSGSSQGGAVYQPEQQPEVEVAKKKSKLAY